MPFLPPARSVVPLLPYVVASAILRFVPLGIAGAMANAAGQSLSGTLVSVDALERNVAAAGANNPAQAARRGIGAYAKYWVDTLRLPGLKSQVIDRRFSFLGYHHILDVQAAGKTPIMVLPHLGSWEWAAAWLGRIEGQRVVAVVERLEPPEVFEWFRATREAYGVEVVPLGSDALHALMAAAKEPNTIICLVADRDIAGNGVQVNFFGRPTTLPAGPALLSLRTGCPLLPVVIYDEGTTRRCHVRGPIWPKRNGKLRNDLQASTQRIADELAALIARAPDQWHVLSDIWHSEGTP